MGRKKKIVEETIADVPRRRRKRRSKHNEVFGIVRYQIADGMEFKPFGLKILRDGAEIGAISLGESEVIITLANGQAASLTY